jgi:hypothetical protein
MSAILKFFYKCSSNFLCGMAFPGASVSPCVLLETAGPNVLNTELAAEFISCVSRVTMDQHHAPVGAAHMCPFH